MPERRVNRECLQSFTKTIFERAGMPPDDAAIEAEVLVWANLRGVDSHGVQRVDGYVHAIDNGYMNPRPDIRIEKETAAILLIEADHAFGPVVTTLAMHKVMEKAREAGIGWALIRNTTHQGAMAYYTHMAAAQQMAGIAVVCNPPNTAPPGARAAGVHNSPLAIAVPGKNKPPISLDMATSVAAHGKLAVAADKGDSIPDTWATDKEGEPTTDPHQAVFLQPAGGYKGYGMALMFECLSSIMVGNPLLMTSIRRQNQPNPGTQNSFVAAIDIAMFTDTDVYGEQIDGTVEALKSLPKKEGVDEILVPGEPENRAYEERSAYGIPLPEATAERLREVGRRFKIETPSDLT